MDHIRVELLDQDWTNQGNSLFGEVRQTEIDKHTYRQTDRHTAGGIVRLM